MRGSPANTLNQVYDPATDSWEIKTPMPNESYGASVVVDDKIYVIGGSYSGDQFHTYTQIYDPETDAWSQRAPPPAGGVADASIFATTGVMAPKRIYILDEVLRVYDPETDSWTFGANIPTYRLNRSMAIVNDMLHVIGGANYTFEYLLTQIIGGSVTPYATNERYTPFGYGTAPPSIDVVSPVNQTYNASDVSLIFTVNKPSFWLGYSLNGKENVTINGNTTIDGLSSGLYSLTVYANDTFGNMGASETIGFSVEVRFPTVLVVAASVASVIIAGVGLLVYFKKRKH